MKHKDTGFGAELVDMRGAIDMHLHSHPCLFPRLVDDLEVALSAKEAGFRAIVYKCHHESSVSRAYYVRSLVPGLEVFGGIVLNSYVGFVNPAAVEATLKLGGKVVWMPTTDAGYHAQVHGGTGKYFTQAGGREQSEGYWILDDTDSLRKEVLEVLDLVAQYNAVLATAHLSPNEILTLVPRAREAGVEKIVITHPFYEVPGLDLDTLERLIGHGAIAEFIYTGVTPMWNATSVDQIANAVRRLGAGHCILVSDSGQRHNPIGPEGLRLFSQMMFEKGIPHHDIEQMIKHTPADLLDLGKPSNAAASPVEFERLLAARGVASGDGELHLPRDVDIRS